MKIANNTFCGAGALFTMIAVFVLSCPRGPGDIISSTDNIQEKPNPRIRITMRDLHRLACKQLKTPKDFPKSPELIDMNEEIRTSKQLASVPYKQEIDQWLKGRVFWLKYNGYDPILKLLNRNDSGISPKLVKFLIFLVTRYIQDTKYLTPDSPQREADLKESYKVLQYLKEIKEKPLKLTRVRINK